MDDPKTTDEKEAYVKRYANLVWNVGTILEDRRDANDSDSSLIWDYLYENLESVYEQIAPTIDEIEDEVFGDFPFDASSIEADPKAAQRRGA